MIETFLVSTGIIALSEVGDKTQLLALALAARFRKPVPIMLGILLATVLNHSIAAYAGEWVAGVVGPTVGRWLLGFLFIAMAIWALIPDRLDEGGAVASKSWGGAFATTAVAFFLVEIGDKTQIATAMLAAHFHALLPVIAGTTLGMMIADVPAILFGHLAGARLDLRWIRFAAAALFLALGLLTILA
jgi:Ca2+/H+ antiporter, TMEM165/GDT1 family